jgi:hypothetical protein
MMEEWNDGPLIDRASRRVVLRFNIPVFQYSGVPVIVSRP